MLSASNNLFLRYSWASSCARHCVMPLRLKDEFIHWGMKNKQKRAYMADKMCKGQGSNDEAEILVAVVHPWGMVSPENNTLDYYLQRRGYHMSWTKFPKDILAYRSSLQGLWILASKLPVNLHIQQMGWLVNSSCINAHKYLAHGIVWIWFTQQLVIEYLLFSPIRSYTRVNDGLVFQKLPDWEVEDSKRTNDSGKVNNIARVFCYNADPRNIISLPHSPLTLS